MTTQLKLINVKVKVSVMHKYYKSNIRIKLNGHNKAHNVKTHNVKYIYNERKIVNHNLKTHKYYANKTPKIVCLNKLFVFIFFY